MRNTRIVKMLWWCIGGLLLLFIGVGAALSPFGAYTGHAASVQIRDEAGVLEDARVWSKASQLSRPISISTVHTFEGPKGDFIRQTERALSGQDAIAIAISVEQRYLAIAAGSQVGLQAEQIAQARQAFAQAYGSSAGANGNYTAATLAAIESLQSSLGNGSSDGIAHMLRVLGGVMSNPLSWLLLLLALTAVGLFTFRRLSGPRKARLSAMEMPWQERAAPKDEYGRKIEPDSGYDSRWHS
jgi:hypothetical protein